MSDKFHQKVGAGCLLVFCVRAELRVENLHCNPQTKHAPQVVDFKEV